MYVSLLTHCGQMNWTETHATTSSLILHFCHRTCTFSSAIHFQQTEEHFLLAVCRCLHTCLFCETKLKLSFKAFLYDYPGRLRHHESFCASVLHYEIWSSAHVGLSRNAL
jgi:hypothetical protein